MNSYKTIAIQNFNQLNLFKLNNMKTPKQLKKYYYTLKRETLDAIEYKKEADRLRSIVGCYPKPLRTDRENDYINFVESTFFCKSRTLDRCCLELKVKRSSKETNETLETEILKHFESFDAAQNWVNKKSKETTRLIDSYFVKYQIELNNLL
jgi:hypothetical protein